MELKRLQKALQDVAGLFTVTGAKSQAKDVRIVADLLKDAPDATAEGFVAETQRALAEAAKDADLATQSAADIVARLRQLDEDRAGFDRVLAVLKGKTVSKELAAEVAGLFTGAGATAYKSKPKALKAIEDKHRDRAFQASKSRANERVTPW
ncbi:MAG: hypothetical protein AB7E70_13200 [Hyphomicrobiaceae bacterium]